MSDSANTRRVKLVVRFLRGAELRKLAVDRRRLHTELGQLVLHWANLQETLANPFRQALECPPHVANAAWHAIKSDLAQRQVLEAALQARCDLIHTNDEETRLKLAVFREYIWASKKMTEMSHSRNDLIHAPIVFWRDSRSTEAEARISTLHDNPRAAKLKDRELYQYARWMNRFTFDMQRFIDNLWSKTRKAGKTPARPKFKPLSDFPTRKQAPKPITIRRRRRKAKAA